MTKSRILAIGDIHGYYNKLQKLLSLIELVKEDELIFLGDYVDKGKDSALVIERLIELSNSNKCTFLLGNHDVGAKNFLLHGDDSYVGLETVESYIINEYDQNEEHKQFFKNLKSYYIDEQDRVFVHGGFTSYRGIGYEPFESNYYWDRTLIESAFAAKNLTPEHINFPNRLRKHKEIYIGHTPTIYYGVEQPMILNNLINIDTGAGLNEYLTVIDINTKQFWQAK